MSKSESEEVSEYSSSEEELEYEKTQEIVDPSVKQTEKEMIEARGYTLVQDLQEGDFKTMIASKKIENKSKSRPSDAPDIHIFFATGYVGGETVKFNTKIVQEYIRHIKKSDLRHVIIIYQGKSFSRGVGEIIKDFITSSKFKIKIETFAQCELKFNITKHEIVPRHVVMSKEDGKKFKQEHGTKFNKMFLTDPVARFYGYEKGDVVVVYRDDDVNYRIVI